MLEPPSSRDDTDRIPNPSPKNFRPAVILPDGRKPVPLGSGTIVSMLGEGGMANVYEIWNAQLEVNRAVKLLHPNCTEESKQRFQTEIKITAKLHHPNIIEIHGVGEWNGLPLIEMEKINGLTLEQLINERGALPIPVCTAIGIMTSRALNYAHNQTYVIYGKEYQGIVHRDLKPSNIMVCSTGMVKLMDFGIARPTDASIHTTDGSILGTMQYLSPEQLDGREADVRTDIYSLGSTLYEIITGEQAFSERNVSKLMMNKIKNNFKSLDHYKLRIPSRLKRLIHKCMEHDPGRRIENSQDLLNQLEIIHSQVTTDTPEKVLQKFLSTSGERHTIGVRRTIPYRTIGITLFTLAVLASIPLFIRKYRQWRDDIEQGAIRRSLTVAEKMKEARESMRAAIPPPSPPTIERETTTVVIERRIPVETKPEPDPPQYMPPTTTFADQMIAKHGINDLIEILVAEVSIGNYENAVKLYPFIPAPLAASDKAVIYYLRALVKTGRRAQARELYTRHPVDDAEVYLMRARDAFADKKVNLARTLLRKSLSSPRQFISSSALKQEAYYYEALCATAIFDERPSEENYKQALDTWWRIRNELRSSPKHEYNRKAINETQRIGVKFRELNE